MPLTCHKCDYYTFFLLFVSFFVSFLMFSRISQSCIIDYWLDLVVLSDELCWLSSVMNAFCLYYYGCSYNCSEAHCRLKSPQLYFIREKL